MPLQLEQNRLQLQLVALEDFIAPDNPVRLIDAFVDYFDLEALGFMVKGKSFQGRPAFSASSLLKLFLYGYLNRVRSSRRLQHAARTNVELFWLLHYQQPCYKTIADFRKTNAKALPQLFKRFNCFLKGQPWEDSSIFDGDLVAIDGSKFGAQNSKKNNYNDRKVKRHLEYIEKQVQAYLSEMESLDDQQDAEEQNIIEVANKLDELTQRQQKYIQLERQLQQARLEGQTQVSTTDCDARALPQKMNIVQMGYNVQVAVQADHKLITNFDVTNQSDTYALSPMAKAAKDFLGQKHLKVLADKGYDTGVELEQCALHGIETYVSPRKKNTSKKHPDYVKEKFVYDDELDCYICPANKQLTSNGNWYKKNDGVYRKAYCVKVYKLPFEICNNCPYKMDCAGQANLKNSKGRPIERSQYEDYLKANRERVKLNKALYRKRQQIVEHPFGTIKRQWGYHFTLLKGKEKVRGEFALIFTCYNLRRAMSIFGVKELLKRLQETEKRFWALLDLIQASMSNLFVWHAATLWRRRGRYLFF